MGKYLPGYPWKRTLLNTVGMSQRVPLGDKGYHQSSIEVLLALKITRFVCWPETPLPSRWKKRNLIS
jgi:hypothetical protein